MDVKHPLNEGQYGCADFISRIAGEISGLAARAASARPGTVGFSPVRPRSNSLLPNARSRSTSSLLAADWVICRRCAASFSVGDSPSVHSIRRCWNRSRIRRRSSAAGVSVMYSKMESDIADFILVRNSGRD
jgi:hypothetical protein